MTASIWFATLALVVLTLLPLLRTQVWWVRGLDFPRLQLSLLTLLLLVVAVAALDLHHWTALVVLASGCACLLYQAWWIVPYTAIFPHEVPDQVTTEPGDTISFMVSNVLTPNRNAAALLSLVQKHAPDIVVTLESDGWWQQQLDSLEPDYPHSIKCPLDNLYGMHVYSRLELQDAKIDYLVEDDVPSMHALVRMQSGRLVRCHFLHPAPPSPTENDSSAQRDAELVIVAGSVANEKLPVIVTGDLNDVAWSRTTRLFRKISGLLDPRVGRGMFNTFHATRWYLRWPLDHLFHSRHFALSRILRLPAIGSDHFPLLTELVLDPTRNVKNDEGLEPDADDREMARNIAINEGVSKRDVPRP